MHIYSIEAHSTLTKANDSSPAFLSVRLIHRLDMITRKIPLGRQHICIELWTLTKCDFIAQSSLVHVEFLVRDCRVAE